MTIEEKLRKTLQTKTGLKEVINNKGGTITDETPFEEYVTQVENLSGGGSFKDIIAQRRHCYNLFYGSGRNINGSSVTGGTRSNLSNLINYSDTENIENFANMFYSAYLENNPSFNMENATTISSMFQNADIKEIDFNKINFNCENINNSFNSTTGNSLQTNLDIQVGDTCNSAYRMFYRSNITNLTKLKITGKNLYNFNGLLASYSGGPYIEEVEINSNTNISVILQELVYLNKYIKKVIVNVSNNSYSNEITISLTNAFNGSTELQEVILNSDKNYFITSTTSAFQNCSKLEVLTLKNIKTSLQIGSGTTYGHLLTLDSLINTCKECVNTGSTLTLTIGTANIEKLASVYVRLTNEAEEDENNPKLPMEVCESTDTGAMTINDYMALKNWSIA